MPSGSRPPSATKKESDKTEDDLQREHLGPRGVPGEPDPARMTPQQKKNIPNGIDDGHVA
jgi:hypothetical protein